MGPPSRLSPLTPSEDLGGHHHLDSLPLPSCCVAARSSLGAAPQLSDGRAGACCGGTAGSGYPLSGGPGFGHEPGNLPGDAESRPLFEEPSLEGASRSSFEKPTGEL